MVSPYYPTLDRFVTFKVVNWKWSQHKNAQQSLIVVVNHGYVRQTKCSDVVNELRMRINALDDNPSFDKTELLIPFEEHYTSRHNRVEGLSPFTIHHLLFSLGQMA